VSRKKRKLKDSEQPVKRSYWLPAAIAAAVLLGAGVVWHLCTRGPAAPQTPPGSQTAARPSAPATTPPNSPTPIPEPPLTTIAVAEAAMVVVDLDYGAEVPPVAQALTEIERYYEPDDGAERTFAILDARTQPAPPGKLELVMHIDGEKAGIGKLIFRRTRAVIWHARIGPQVKPVTSAYAGKSLFITIADAKDKPWLVDGAHGAPSILDCGFTGRTGTVRDQWADDEERQVTFFYSVCGCPVEVMVRRAGNTTVRSSDLPVLFPDDPSVAATINGLMGWSAKAAAANAQPAPARFEPPPVPAAGAVSALKFSPAEPDFGELPAGQQREITLQVENPTDTPVRLTDLQTSCSCLDPRFPAGVIGAHQTAPLSLTCRGWSGSKKNEMTVTFRTDEPNRPLVTVPARCVVKQEFTVEPETVQFGHMKRGETKTAAAVVKRLDGQAFRIKQVVAAVPQMTFRWEPEAGGAAEQKLIITVAAGKPGNITTNAIITTDHPTAPVVQFMVNGMVDAEVLFTPAFVQAAGRKTDNRVGDFTTVVKRLTPGKLEILGVTEKLGLPVDYTVTPLEEGSARLTIRFKDPYPQRAPVGQFEVRTNVDENPLALAFRVNLR
jgi:hypothetical protein